jgi:hypothetical protein
MKARAASRQLRSDSESRIADPDNFMSSAATPATGKQIGRHRQSIWQPQQTGWRTRPVTIVSQPGDRRHYLA